MISNEIPIWLEGDELRIKQILVNVIGNAVKFTKQGFIKVICEYEEGFLVIKVIDSGIGIPENKIGKIFDPFEQSDSSISKEFQGTGLGLPISLKLAKMMGGNITLNSMPDKGSEFLIRLKLKETLPPKIIKIPSTAVIKNKIKITRRSKLKKNLSLQKIKQPAVNILPKNKIFLY